ncbi:MAG TPA: FAD-dependent oxidoreductase [Nitriliruptorales bacterium]|nr:FAD-dependent oxidoreductase [Nitriliruptorales bacterium]
MSDHFRTSLWHGTAATTAYPPLDGDGDADVVVVGAGITGLTTALLLAESGLAVTVVEARDIACGTTGGSTGKLTSQHGVIYASLRELHGDDVAEAYGRVNEAAIREVAAICERHGIDASWTNADAYVYAQTDGEVERLRQEEAAATALGLPAVWSDTTELPFDVRGALRFTGQAQLHPVAYAHELAAAVRAQDFSQVHTETRVTDVHDEGDGVTVTTDRGRVRADHVVLATLLPITDRGFEFARARASRSYGIAARIDGDLPEHMYLSAGEPTRSIRRHMGDGDGYLVVVGDAHEVGHDQDTDEHFVALESFARQNYAVRDVVYRWSAQDFFPDDRLPLIGTTVLSDRIHVATGFQKWGLTLGTAAARIIAGAITGQPDADARFFSPTRVTITASARRFLEHNLDVALRFVSDRVLPDYSSIDAIPAGGGGTIRVDGQLLAVSKDDQGRVTKRSATCTHLACIVQWNQAERSWDCPCHGSRFSAGGDVLEGPATAPLDHA